MSDAPRGLYRKIVEDWKYYWMNQKQNSEEDYQNYFRRAFGVDANMMYSLEKKIEETCVLKVDYDKLKSENDRLWAMINEALEQSRVGNHYNAKSLLELALQPEGKE